MNLSLWRNPKFHFDFYACSDFVNSFPNNLLLGSQCFLTAFALSGDAISAGFVFALSPSFSAVSLSAYVSLCLFPAFGVCLPFSPLICQAELPPLCLLLFIGFNYYLFFFFMVVILFYFIWFIFLLIFF